MKRITAVFLLLAMVLSLAACSSNKPTEPSTEPTTVPTEPSAEPSTEPTLPEGTKVYTVKVVDERDTPVAGVVVQWCLDTCFPGVTNAEGVAQYTAPEADYHVQINSVPSGYTADTQEYTYEAGSYELTITIQAPQAVPAG